jgi:peptide/nickel transport system permease protein
MPPLLRRSLVLIASIFAIVTFNFFLFHVIPGDPIRLIARSQRLSPDAVAHLRQLYGLDGSMLTQYVDYLKNLLHGDLGYSYSLQEDVSAIVGRALVNTVILLTCSTLIVVLVGVGVGVFAGSRVGKKSDSATVVTSLVMWSLPTFWVGMLLLFTFGVWIGGLPISGIQTPNAIYPNFFWLAGDVGRHLVLPTITLAIVDIAFFIIITRTSLVEVSGEDYMLTARGKGLSRRRIVWGHGVRNALLPVVTASVLYISALVPARSRSRSCSPGPGWGSSPTTRCSRATTPCSRPASSSSAWPCWSRTSCRTSSTGDSTPG